MSDMNALQIVVPNVTESDGKRILQELELLGMDVEARWSGPLLESLDAPETTAEWTYTIAKVLWNPAIVGAISAAVVKIYRIHRAPDSPLVYRCGDQSIEAKNADEAIKFIKALKQSPLPPQSGPVKP